jgi:hypothetical protein
VEDEEEEEGTTEVPVDGEEEKPNCWTVNISKNLLASNNLVF